MQKRVELPIVEPLCSTYHHQGQCTAVMGSNPSIRNWYLNEVIMLRCDRRFLSGYTSPELRLNQSAWSNSPCLERVWYPMRHIKGHVHYVIRQLLDDGFYVCFSGIDDYYVEGKSWYKEKHFNHDGMICGYDDANKAYCLYAYDSNWIYQKFWTSQKSFEAGRRAMFKEGHCGTICGIKPKSQPFDFDPVIALRKIREYLDANMRQYPPSGEGEVLGIAVQRYVAMYVDKLYDGSIPYERMDRRVFRLLWEHKKLMLERLKKIEEALKLNSRTSTAYRRLVSEAGTMRMLYASHHMRRRDAVLPIIRDKLLALHKRERELLRRFVKKTEGAMSQ